VAKLGHSLQPHLFDKWAKTWKVQQKGKWVQWGLKPDRVAVWVFGGRLAEELWLSSGTASSHICWNGEQQGE
jgi:hypothetical protein